MCVTLGVRKLFSCVFALLGTLALLLVSCVRPYEAELPPETPDAPLFSAGVEVRPGVLDFGAIPVGASAGLEFEIFSTDEAALEINNIALADESLAGVFILSERGPFNPLTQNESVVVRVTFTPSRGLEFSTSIVISANIEGGVVTLGVFGSGLDEEGQLDADQDGAGSDVDCQDDDPAVYPGALEIPYDAIDQDCDGTDLDDVDRDSFESSVVGGTDCVDTDDTVYPGALDVAYDGIDQDCDGSDTEDWDGDGFASVMVSGDDCNDADSTIFPGALEVPYDAVDQDCNGHDLVDVDGDGFAATSVGGDDCNDLDALINPITPDVPYDGVDQDCVAGDLTDVDEDGVASDAVAGGTDCNDVNSEVYPSSMELPYDGIDQDCSGSDWVDVDGDSFPAELVGGSDCDDSNPNVYPSAIEIIDQIDNDCDGFVDEVYDTGDDDGDGYSEHSGDCNDFDPSVFPGAAEIPYDAIDQNCDGTDLTDVDSDGFEATTVGGADCNDNDATVNPASDEVCNQLDDDCDGNADDGVTIVLYLDEDSDSFGRTDATRTSCVLEYGYSIQPNDCDDENPAIYPGATETCNGVDDNCDASIDPGLTFPYYPDSDEDGFGAAIEPEQFCETPDGYVLNGSDCDDANAASYPGAPEVCNGADEDCDQIIDDGVLTTYYIDSDGDSFGELSDSTEECIEPEGYAAISGDCLDSNASVYPGAEEILYDGLDQNCDGSDLNDVDRDGYISVDASGDDCDDQNATVYPNASEFEDDLDNNCNGLIDENLDSNDDDYDGYSEESGDCNDSDPSTFPDADEVCNLVDDDCNGQIDEGVSSDYYYDADSDGFGATNPTTSGCSPPENYAAYTGDCDDVDSTAYPGAQEVCDQVDNNCDGAVDEDLIETYYVDNDGDAWGGSVSIDTCSAPAGYALESGDCNDNDSHVNPDTTEVCNGIDDDCDDVIDENLLITYYRDTDADSWGSTTAVEACTQPLGYVVTQGDCDDSRSDVCPFCLEVCDAVDNDCDDEIDEFVTQVFYLDLDSDGYGDSDDTIDACVVPEDYSIFSGDCDDASANIYPGAAETCNGLDDDCDVEIDENVLLTYYSDDDSDGFGDSTSATFGCTVPIGTLENGEDCDDTNSSINPNADEICDSLDNNCDGVIDGSDSLDATTWYYDADQDGYGVQQPTTLACSQPENYADNAADCDDSSEWQVVEICDGEDNDCDGNPDFVGGYPVLEAGYYSSDIVAGDLNNDGWTDLVIVNRYSSSVSVMHYTGGGSFDTRQTVATASQPIGAVLEDFDSDGDLDIITANYVGNSLSYVSNDGFGNFSTVTSVALGFAPQGIVAADIDSDGDQDLALSNYTSTGVTILVNERASFSILGSVAVESRPYGLTPLDIDLDSDLDIVCTNFGKDSISLLLNSGTGVLTNVGSISVEDGPIDVTAADINRDGRQDLAVAHYNASTVRILVGTTSNSFSFSQSITTGKGAYSIISYDLDQDATPEFITTNLDANSLTILRKGSSSTYSVLESPGVGSMPSAVVGGDFDDDGDGDLATANVSSQAVTTAGMVLRNDGSGHFLAPGALTIDAAAWFLAASDLDGDGLEDLAITHQSAGSVAAWIQSPDHHFAKRSSVSGLEKPYGLSTGDFDSDGYADLVVANASSKGLSILHNDGSGLLSVVQTLNVSNAYTYDAVPIDLDADRDLDIVCSSYSSGGVTSQALGTFLNDGAGGFLAGSSVTVGTYPQDIEVGDFNTDGFSDLLVANRTEQSVSVVTNASGITLSETTVILMGDSVGNLSVGDLNGDYILDFAAPRYNLADVVVYVGDGQGGFSLYQALSVGVQPSDVALLDFDGDLDLDILVSHQGPGTISILVNDGTGKLALAGLLGVAGTAYSLQPLNNGEGAGVAVASHTTNFLTVLTSECR